MIFTILRQFVKYSLFAFYRKYFVSKPTNIPKGKPYIIALNHPTAFSEPMMVECLYFLRLHFMLRGDMFNTPFKRWFLGQIKNVPIFRARDGLESVKKNKNVFESCFDMLSKNKSILILAEGISKHEKKLRPIQKGTARMAFGTFDKYGIEELYIIPAGVNYTAAKEFRSDVMLELGEPIAMADFIDEYKTDNRKGVNSLTAALQSKMEELVIHFNESRDERFCELVLEVNRNNHPQPPVYKKVIYNLDRAKEEFNIAQSVNGLDKEIKHELTLNSLAYAKLLKKAGVPDRAVVEGQASNLLRFLMLLVLSPIMVPILLINWPLFFGIKKFADANMKQAKFHSSVRVALAAFTFPVYYLILYIIGHFTIGFPWALLIFLLPTLINEWAFSWRDQFFDWLLALKYKRLSKENKTAILETRKQISDWTLKLK